MVAPDVDFGTVKTTLGGIVSCLHLQEQIHADSEGFLQMQSHLRGDRGFSIGYFGQGCAPDSENFRRAGQGKAEGTDNILPDDLAWMGRILHRHDSSLLVIVFKIQVGDDIALHRKCNAPGSPTAA